MVGHRPLPTTWSIYNLSQSPYFQRELEAGPHSRRPLSLFVGRAAELDDLLGTIRDAGDDGSVQGVAGALGVGKTTLVKELKARALEDGFLTTDAIVPVLQSDTPESLFARVLGGLYDTILANRPQSGGNPAMQDAQPLVRATRLSSVGVSLSIPGAGGLGGSRGTSVVTPKDIMIDGPRIMRDLMRMIVEQSDARGVLLHLNNLENLSDTDAKRAGETFKTLRDVMLLHNGLHFVLVGTTDAVGAALGSQQVRNHAWVLPLVPLRIDEVHTLLAARYEYLRADPKQPPINPVEEAAVEALYDLFGGDLRGLLRALEDGVKPLLGLVTVPPRPLSIEQLRPVLQRRYDEALSALKEQGWADHLRTWGTRAPAATQTQTSLRTLWQVGQSAASKIVNYLVAEGYVVALPRRPGRHVSTEYVLSGRSRLIFG